jgi:hypothetical protein
VASQRCRFLSHEPQERFLLTPTLAGAPTTRCPRLARLEPIYAATIVEMRQRSSSALAREQGPGLRPVGTAVDGKSYGHER